MVEIINSKEFFEILQARGVRKSEKEHENLKVFLALDANYPHMVMLKKVAKALDEMAKNEELMAGILAAAEEDIAAAEGQIDEYGDDDQQQDVGEKRLITIGEDGEEENQKFDTNNRPKGKANQNDNYDEYNEDDNDDDDYEF